MTERLKKPRRLLDQAFDDSGITGNVKLVFLVMCRRGNASGLCFMSINSIVEACGISRSTVTRSISKLRDSGRIVPHERRAGTVTWCYSLHPGRQNDLRLRSNRPKLARQNDAQNLKENPKENPAQPVDDLVISKRRCRAESFGSIAKDISKRTNSC